MLMELQPIFMMFAVTSASKTLLGDKYLAKLTFLKTELSKVQAAQVKASAAVSGPATVGVAGPPWGVTWNMGSLNLTPLIPAAPQATMS
jgi:hypothetical protein